MNDRDLLATLAAGPTSGEALAARLGISRSAVHKRVEALREAGIGIDAQAGRGYALRHPCELLDAKRIRDALSSSRALLATLDVDWIVDSSNSVLLRREGSGEGADVLLVEGQSGGRGRRGREWRSPLAANLYLSLARRYAGGLARLGGLSLAAGVAVAEALRSLGVEARLKWPNDLVVDGRKLGGLLVEGGGEHAGPVRAVVGLGLNVRMPEAAARGIDQPWIDLAEAAPRAMPRNALAAAVLDRLLPALEAFDRDGLSPFLQRFAVLDALRDRDVRVHGAADAWDGIASGLADDGGLRVRLADGAFRTVHAGEVSVRAA